MHSRGYPSFRASPTRCPTSTVMLAHSCTCRGLPLHKAGLFAAALGALRGDQFGGVGVSSSLAPAQQRTCLVASFATAQSCQASWLWHCRTGSVAIPEVSARRVCATLSIVCGTNSPVRADEPSCCRPYTGERSCLRSAGSCTTPMCAVPPRPEMALVRRPVRGQLRGRGRCRRSCLPVRRPCLGDRPLRAACGRRC